MYKYLLKKVIIYVCVSLCLTIVTVQAGSYSVKKLHIAGGVGFSETRANNEMYDAFIDGGFGGVDTIVVSEYFGWYLYVDYPQDGSEPFYFYMDIEYNIFARFRTGIEFNTIAKQEVRGKYDAIERLEGYTINCFFDYVILPFYAENPLPYESCIGCGFSYNDLSVDETIGGYLRCTFDYYLVPDFSFQIKVDGRILSSINIPARVHVYEHRRRVLPGYSVDMSSINISLGTRLHL